LEMKPWIRLEGRIDQRVPRPVKNGRVVINVRPPQFPASHNYDESMQAFIAKYGYADVWTSFRPIAGDGTFVFESIPPGDVEVITCGDGFISKKGDELKTNDGSIGVPQSFPLTTPTTRIEVLTEQTATVEVFARTEDGKPVQGANVQVNPNTLRGLGTTIFGGTYTTDEEPFRKIEELPSVETNYLGITDQNGIAILRNLPAFTRWLEVQHPELEEPLREGNQSRATRIRLTSGATTKVTITLQPKGKSFIGSSQSFETSHTDSPINLQQESDGRWHAVLTIEDGIEAYGASEDEALRNLVHELQVKRGAIVTPLSK